MARGMRWRRTRNARGWITVTACGASLCVDGAHWMLDGASVYADYGDPAGTVQLARQARLNTLRVVDFIPRDGDPNTVPYTTSYWTQADQMIAAAAQGGL